MNSRSDEFYLHKISNFWYPTEKMVQLHLIEYNMRIKQIRQIKKK